MNRMGACLNPEPGFFGAFALFCFNPAEQKVAKSIKSSFQNLAVESGRGTVNLTVLEPSRQAERGQVDRATQDVRSLQQVLQ